MKKRIEKIRQRCDGMLKRLAESGPGINFAFCESVNATGTSPWHIRKLTDKGLKLGGGADTDALCGREMAWDLNVDIAEHHLNHCCQNVQIYSTGVIDMIDQTEFFECSCMSDEHTLVFKSMDGDLYTSIFLNKYRNIFKRVWVAIKYIFGYKCQYGHWDCTIFKPEEINRLIELLQKHEMTIRDYNE